MKLYILTLITLLGLGWVLNEMKPEPKDKSYYHISKPDLFYK